MKPLLVSAIASWIVTVSLAGETVTCRDLVGRLTNLERLATPVIPREKTFASTSHDRGGKYDPKTDTYSNWSANNDGGGCIRREGESQVMVELEGAGVLWRIWSAMAKEGHIRIYLDGGEKPVIDKPFGDYFGDYEKDYPGLPLTKIASSPTRTWCIRGTPIACKPLHTRSGTCWWVRVTRMNTLPQMKVMVELLHCST